MTYVSVAHLPQDASKLAKEYPEIPHAQKSIVEVFKRMKANIEKEKQQKSHPAH